MEPSMFLTDEEIASLTQKKRYATQRRVLNALGVTHKIRPDGSIAILRSHVEQVFGGNVTPPKRCPTEPNWAALNQLTPGQQQYRDRMAAAKKRRNEERQDKGLPPLD